MINAIISKENYSSESTDEILKKEKTYDSATINQISCGSLFIEKTKDSSELLSNENSQSNDEMMSYNKIELSNQISEYRKAFYYFFSLIKNHEEIAKHYSQLFQKSLSSNFRSILSFNELSDSFEKQLFRLAKAPRQARKNWSEEDSQFLISLVAYFCGIYSLDHTDLVDNTWQHLAKIYPAKTQEQLRLKWQSILKVPLSKVPWSPKEDEVLVNIVQERGTDHWRDIAIELNYKSGTNLFRQGKQCRERWTNHLDPNLKKGSWSEDEDLILLKEFLQKGKKWSEISKKLPGRTENSVKNRWISLLRKYKGDLTLETIKEAEKFENDEDAWNNHIIKLLIESKEKLVTPSNSGVNPHETKKEPVKKLKIDPLESNLEGQEFSKATKARTNHFQTKDDKMTVTPQVSNSESTKGYTPQDMILQKEPFRSNDNIKMLQQNLQIPPCNPTQFVETKPELAPSNVNNPQLSHNNFSQVPNHVMQPVYPGNGNVPQMANGNAHQMINGNMTEAIGPNMYQTVPAQQNFPLYSMPQMPQMAQGVSYPPMQYQPFNSYPPVNPWNTNFYPNHQPNPYANPGMQMWYPSPNHPMNQPQPYSANPQQMGMATQYQPVPMLPNPNNEVSHQFGGVQSPNFNENKSTINPKNPNVYFAMVDMNSKEIFFLDQVNQSGYNKALETLKSNEPPDNSVPIANNQSKNIVADSMLYDNPVCEDNDMNRLFENFL